MFAKVRVKLTCSVCGEGLSTYAMMVNGNTSQWALTEKSHKHVSEAHR